MNHKRRRPKHQRAGCIWCKPHKDERRRKVPRSPAVRAILEERRDVEDEQYWEHERGEIEAP